MADIVDWYLIHFETLLLAKNGKDISRMAKMKKSNSGVFNELKQMRKAS